MNAKPNPDLEKNIFELPEIKAKYSSKVVSKVVTITFSIIAMLILIAFLVVNIFEIDVTIDAGGQLEPTNLYYVHSPLNAEIEKIFVKSGDTFKKDDILVQFDSVKLSDQVEKLINDLSIKKIDYEMKSRSIPYEIDQNEIQIKKADAQLLKSRANLRQKMGDYFPGVNADSFLISYKKGSHITLDYALAEIISSEAELENLKTKKESIELKNLELKSLSLEINQLEKNIIRQNENLKKTKLKAPFDGIVLTEDLQRLEKSVASEGFSIFEISQSNTWKALLNVSEKDVYELSVGDSVKIEVKAMKQSDEFLLFSGKVVSISAEQIKDKSSQASNGYYKVEVAVDLKNSDKYLKRIKRGFSIDAKIIKNTDKIINILLKNIRKII